MFDTDSEQQKRAARVKVIEWLEAQRIEVGDEVFMPNPNTGVMESWTQDNKRH